ncbi:MULTISPECIES: LCP family protein [Rossellomorea]|uniref:Transcriptional regulator LytR n=1 Tax=Rossellomorea vietnamensis TaxID=218284 RepID=A0A6I6UPL0_9BACI|nr:MULTISPECIES: LCP family protein [Rossellomorea]QHE63327.1 transcriptional regulator LytR [Rossellomorea vietnamensis]WGG45386.1 LCP family protein [Rossellomorea sp. DA94]
MKKKIILSVVSVVVLLFLGIGGYAYYMYDSVKGTAESMHEEVKRDKPKDTPKITQEKDEPAEPISILMMGVDERQNDQGRSDALIVMTLNPEKEKMQMISIPRDTRTEIIGHGTTDKINHAYAFGGTKMAIETVENFTNIPIDYYIKVNMEALSSLVDAMDGVTVHNDLDWYDEGYYKKGYHYREGDIELNGAKALGYVRMRHLDPRGDFGRNERQRQVIAAIIGKASNVSSVGKFDDILDVLGNNVKTDMTLDDIMSIQKNYRSAKNTIEQYEIKGQGGKIGGTYYLTVPENEQDKVTEMLKENLAAS